MDYELEKRNKELLYKKYVDQGFLEDQLAEIKLGIDQDINVEIYAKKEMPAREMACLRKELFAKKTSPFQEVEPEEKFDPEYEEIKKRKTQIERAYISLVLYIASVVCVIVAVLTK